MLSTESCFASFARRELDRDGLLCSLPSAGEGRELFAGGWGWYQCD